MYILLIFQGSWHAFFVWLLHQFFSYMSDTSDWSVIGVEFFACIKILRPLFVQYQICPQGIGLCPWNLSQSFSLNSVFSESPNDKKFHFWENVIKHWGASLTHLAREQKQAMSRRVFVAKFPISPSSQLIRQDLADLVIHYNNPIFLAVSLGSGSFTSSNFESEHTSFVSLIAIQSLDQSLDRALDKSVDRILWQILLTVRKKVQGPFRVHSGSLTFLIQRSFGSPTYTIIILIFIKCTKRSILAQRFSNKYKAVVAHSKGGKRELASKQFGCHWICWLHLHRFLHPQIDLT